MCVYEVTKSARKKNHGRKKNNSRMNHCSVQHLETVVSYLGNLRLRDTRNLFSILRQIDPKTRDNIDEIALANAFLPEFGVSVGEVGFSYVVNQPSRTSSKKQKS